MAALTGRKGRVQYGGADVLRLNNWTLDIETNIHDVTSFTTGNVQWRSNLAGLNGARGTVSGFWDISGSTAQKDMQTNLLTPTTAQMILYVQSSAGDNYRFSSLLSRQSINTNIDAPVDISLDFVATGAVTYSTAT